MEQHNLKGEAVETHPLSRTSSNSSSSSLELDSRDKRPYVSPTEIKLQSRRARGSSAGRWRDFLSKSEDQSKVENSDGKMYYNIWQNKSKILSNLKKQATESVRQLTQSASLDTGSNQGFFFKTHEGLTETPQKADTAQNPSAQAGLIKVATENIAENSHDNDVTNYLQEFKDKISDPLSALRKKEEEDRQNEEDRFFDEPFSYSRGRSLTTNSVPTAIGKETRRRTEAAKPVRKSVTNSSSSKVNAITVSLSSLMAGKPDNIEDDIITENADNTKHDHVPQDPESNGRAKPEVSNVTVKKVKDEKLVPEQPSLRLVFLFTFLIFLYFILPLPRSVRIACSCFVLGCIFTTAFLCIFAPRSRRPEPFLPTPVNSSVPHTLPLSVYDPDQPIRGWMNEISAYDPETYHISNTSSVFVTLDGATLRLQTPQKSIPRRSVYNEGRIPISNVAHQRMFDLTFAKVYLRPPGLVKKRVWSKKYPICVEICEKPSDSKGSSSSVTSATKQDNTKQENVHKDSKLVYLFGRTDRQKEEWFYRIQRSINIAYCKYKRSQKASETKQKKSEIGSIDLSDEWGIIEDHYEEEIFVASSVCDITKHTNQPVRLLQDYFVHISRLFPQKTNGDSPRTPKTYEKSASEKWRQKIDKDDVVTEDSQVSWVNVMVGRVMFDVLRQPLWTKWVSVKVQKKLDKIKLPYFIGELKLTEMNLGSSVPLLHEISLPKLDSQGIWIDAQITYSGAVQMTLKTKLVLTKLGKNETLLLDRESGNRSNAVTDSDAEDSAESSDDEDESAMSRMFERAQSAVAQLNGPQILKDAFKSMGKDTPNDFSSSPSPISQPEQPLSQGAAPPPKKWIRIVDSIAKSKYFQKATETDYIRKKLETVSNTPMLLTVELVQLSGTLVINIPPPPTDRIWYGFREPPTMLLKAHPKVGERVVKTTHVTDWIENKLQQEVIKFLVMPNMDDIPMPIMFHNRREFT